MASHLPVSKSYNSQRFRKVLNSKTSLAFKNDQSDMLVYLIYVNYLNKMIESKNITQTSLKQKHINLLKRYSR